MAGPISLWSIFPTRKAFLPRRSARMRRKIDSVQMTNLVIPHVVSISNVALTNVITTTNADGSVVHIGGQRMQTIMFGPGALVLVLLAVALIVMFLWRTFKRGESRDV